MMPADPQISFVIATAGQRDGSLQSLCAAIQRTVTRQHEIILVGEVRKSSPALEQIISCPELAERAEICAMRNLGGEAASGELIVFLDDDILWHHDWPLRIDPLFNEMIAGSVDIGGCRIIGPNGRRWYDWSWGSRADVNCPSMLLPYGRQHDSLYISGCCMIMRRDTWEEILFDENRLNHQHDDVDFCHRALDRAKRFKCRPEAVLTHLLLPVGRNVSDPASGEGKGEGEAFFPTIIHAYRSGRLKEAARLLDRHRKDIPDLEYHYYGGLFLFLLNDLPEAKCYFEKAITSSEARENDALLSQAIYRLGLIALKEKNYSEATDLFTSVLKLIPDHPFARLRLQRLNGLPMII